MTSSDVQATGTDGFLTGPMERLQHILEEGERGLARRRAELAEVRHALFELGTDDQTPRGWATGAVERLPAHLAPPLIRFLTETTVHTLRSCVASLDAGPGLDDESVRSTQERLSQRRFTQRTIYPMGVMDTDVGRAWVRSWAAVGEEQRLSLVPPSDFAIFDSRAVVAVEEWSDPTSDLVVIRQPMLVSAFTELFDLCFARALPVAPRKGVEEQEDDDVRLVRLLGLGLKDESIARHLGCSLRTVRRRVALLMDGYGVQTRFQLGVAAAQGDLLSLGER